MTSTGIGIGRKLDPSLRSIIIEDFERALRHKVVGQDPAVDAVIDIYQMFTAGLNPPFRPVGNLLFLGPTGTGKTHVIETLAEVLFGDKRALIKIDCAEFQHSHEIAKLIGSPPGYLGHRETHPILTQEALNQWHTQEHQITLLLFDEIEKASDSLWNLLLGILDKATLTLGDTRRVDLSRCLIVLTSNLGASQMQGMVEGGMGFKTALNCVNDQFDTKIEKAAEEAAHRRFSPEFMNRLDKVVVFKTLREEHLKEILNIELGMLQQRILSCVGNSQFVFVCSDEVKAMLLKEGIDPKYGARHLKRTIEKKLVFPLSNLVSSGQINLGDMVAVDLDSTGAMTFTLTSQGALVPVMMEKLQTTSPVEAKNHLKKANESFDRAKKLADTLGEDGRGLNDLLNKLKADLAQREMDKLKREPPVAYSERRRPKPKPRTTE